LYNSINPGENFINWGTIRGS